MITMATTLFELPSDEEIQRIVGLHPDTIEKLLWTLGVIGLAWLLRQVIARIISKRTKDSSKVYIGTKTAGYLLGFIATIAVIRIWFGGFVGLGAYFGILSAGLAIALKDPLTNFAGWIFISLRRLFVIGDRIQIGDKTGDVIDIRLFHFSLLEVGNWVHADQSTGRIIHVPNGLTFQQPVANYTQGFNFIWNEIPVTVTFESNWRKAKEILSEIGARHTIVKSEHAAQQVRRAAEKYLIYFRELTPIVWTTVAEHGVVLTLRYLCPPRNRRSSETAIWEEILQAFAQADDIDFAYPTQRFYDNAAEGKSGTTKRPTGTQEPTP